MVKLTKKHWVFIGIAIAMIIMDFAFFLQEKIFYFIIGLAVIMGAIPFFLVSLMEVGREKDKEEMFLEFSRNLVESVKAGIPVSRAIINVSGKSYGSLSPHVIKLGNQIKLGIPVSQALKIFANDIKNRVISRSIILITEAEKSGGDIALILESVAKSVSEIEDLKKERRTSMYNLVMEGYIIFIIFIIIMIVMQVKLIPLVTSTISAAETKSPAGGDGIAGGFSGGESIAKMNQIFFILIMVQSLFAGLVIGKLSEGILKAGIKHSFILLALSLLITTGANAFGT